MTPTASGLDEARERLWAYTCANHLLPMTLDGEAATIVTLADLRLLLASEAALREALKRAEAHMAATGSISAAWKRGVMFAVERMDIVLGKISTKKAAPGLIEDARGELDRLTDFQRQNAPATYTEAFRLSEDENARCRAARLSQDAT